MDVLLTHGYFLHEDPVELEVMRPYPPLGILYISSHLRARGFTPGIFDSTFRSRREFEDLVAQERPPVVGIYCNMMTRSSALRMIPYCRAAGAVVVVGGPDPASYATEYLAAGADVVVVGEGEETLEELLPHLSANGPTGMHHIAGIIYREEDEEVRTAPRAYLADLDAQPFPDRKAIDIRAYMDIWREHHGMGPVSLITARGCPYTCTWCSHAVFGYSHRRRSVENVVDEVEQILAEYEPDMLWYADDVFTIHRRWFFAYAQELKRRGIHIPFETISREDRLDEEVVRTLAEMGCHRLWVGSESGSCNRTASCFERARIRICGSDTCYSRPISATARRWTSACGSRTSWWPGRARRKAHPRSRGSGIGTTTDSTPEADPEANGQMGEEAVGGDVLFGLANLRVQVCPEGRVGTDGTGHGHRDARGAGEGHTQVDIGLDPPRASLPPQSEVGSGLPPPYPSCELPQLLRRVVPVVDLHRVPGHGLAREPSPEAVQAGTQMEGPGPREEVQCEPRDGGGERDGSGELVLIHLRLDGNPSEAEPCAQPIPGSNRRLHPESRGAQGHADGWPGRLQPVLGRQMAGKREENEDRDGRRDGQQAMHQDVLEAVRPISFGCIPAIRTCPWPHRTKMMGQSMCHPGDRARHRRDRGMEDSGEIRDQDRPPPCGGELPQSGTGDGFPQTPPGVHGFLWPQS